MVGIEKYSGTKYKNLSMTPINDLKLMATTLKKADYCLENTYENVNTNIQFEGIISAYVDSINRTTDEIGQV